MQTNTRESLSANQQIIKEFSDWQTSRNASYEERGHRMQWSFDVGLVNILYTDKDGQTFRILTLEKDDPIEVSFQAPNGFVAINEENRAKVINNVATLISALSLSKVRTDQLRSGVESLFSSLSMAQGSSSSGQPAAKLPPQSEETKRKIVKIKEIINNGVALIESGNRSIYLANNPSYTIKIAKTKDDINTLVYSDQNDGKRYVGEIHGDELVFFELKTSDKKPTQNNKINDPTLIEHISTLIYSAVSLTSTSSRSGQASSGEARSSAGGSDAVVSDRPRSRPQSPNSAESTSPPRSR